jgi:hypothetical protein
MAPVKVFVYRLVSAIVKAVALEDVPLLVQDVLLDALVAALDVVQLVALVALRLVEVLAQENVLLAALDAEEIAQEVVILAALDVVQAVRMDVLQDVWEDAVILVRVNPT